MLRLEGHIALWAGALLSVAAIFLRGAEPPGLSPGVELLDAAVAPVAGRIASVSAGVGQAHPRVLPDLDRSGRTLFAGVASVEPAPVVPHAAPVLQLPLLKGVISDGAAPRAVLSTADNPTTYVTAGVGEVAVGFRIERIETDQVVAVSPKGEAVVLKLRGAGELP